MEIEAWMVRQTSHLKIKGRVFLACGKGRGQKGTCYIGGTESRPQQLWIKQTPLAGRRVGGSEHGEVDWANRLGLHSGSRDHLLFDIAISMSKSKLKSSMGNKLILLSPSLFLLLSFHPHSCSRLKPIHYSQYFFCHQFPHSIQHRVL